MVVKDMIICVETGRVCCCKCHTNDCNYKYNINLSL